VEAGGFGGRQLIWVSHVVKPTELTSQGATVVVGVVMVMVVVVVCPFLPLPPPSIPNTTHLPSPTTSPHPPTPHRLHLAKHTSQVLGDELRAWCPVPIMSSRRKLMAELSSSVSASPEPKPKLKKGAKATEKPAEQVAPRKNYRWDSVLLANSPNNLNML
jgi:hypothetical protein